MTRDDALARLAVCAAEARAALLACGLDDVSDASVAGAIADADAELEASVALADGRLVHVLRRRRKALIALHEDAPALAEMLAAVGVVEVPARPETLPLLAIGGAL